MRSTAIVFVVAMFAMTACAPELPESGDGASEAPLIPSVTAGTARLFGPGNILPAFETAAERATRGKFDSNDDFRIKNAHWYAQTRPPTPGKFRPFGEWENMSAVWTTYSNGMVNTPPVRRMFAEQTINFIRHSNPKVLAKVIVSGNAAGNDFFKALDTYGITAGEKKLVQLVTMPHDTIWHIDYGVFPLVDKKSGTVAFADWVYYKPRVLDDAIPTRLANDYYKATVFRTPFPFEGGNIQADGIGTCATTVRALQNTGYSTLKVRNLLKNYAACNKTLIIKDITDDGTGHIDMFFKWVDTETVLLGRYENSIKLDYDGDGKVETLPLPGKVAADYAKTWTLNQQRMDDDAALFGCVESATGKPYKVHRLTMMTRFKDDYGDLPRTFINSTFTNGVNVYPSYATSSCRDPQGQTCMQDNQCAAGQHCASARCTNGPAARGCDELVGCGAGETCTLDPLKVALTNLAQSQWEKAMPAWKHVGLRADTIGLWSGAIHCITRTIPVGAVAKVIADGTCNGGKCGGVAGGTTQGCSASSQCSGPKWDCNCNICKGTCANGGACTDDADCSADGVDVKQGACAYNANQACYVGSVQSKSCAGKCGSYAEGAACQCDDQCSQYGDCCADYKELCPTGGNDGLQVQCDEDGGPTPDAGPSDAGWPDTGGPQEDTGGAKDAGCAPQCQGKSCGPDGCGGSCGPCVGGATCNSSGQCSSPQVDAGPNNPDVGGDDSGECAPNCAGKSCGDDGCGGTCGACTGDQICSAGGQCQGGGTDVASQQDTTGAVDAAPPGDGSAVGVDTAGVDTGAPIASDAVSEVMPPAHFVPGRASSCGAGGPDHRGGLVLLLCLLTLAWRRREACSGGA